MKNKHSVYEVLSNFRCGLVRIALFSLFTFLTLPSLHIFATVEDYTLFEAVKNGDIETVKKFLDEGGDVATKYADMTLLEKAVIFGRMDIVELLLSKGADINDRDGSGETLLHSVARISPMTDAAFSTSFYSMGGEATFIGLDDPQIVERSETRMKFARFLISKGVDINALDDFGRTPLYLASESVYPEMVSLLLQHGADVNAGEKDSIPLTAVFEHCLYTVDLDNKDFSPFDNKTVVERIIPFLEYHKESIKQIAKMLVEHGADVNASESDYYGGVLYSAAMCGYLDMAEYFVKKGANVKVADSITPLHMAVGWGRLEVAKFLIDKGADVNEKDADYGTTPIHFASDECKYGVGETVGLLIEHGADIEAREKREGQTPLIEAAAEGCFSIAETLLAHGAEVNAEDAQKWTSLHLAARNDHVDIAKLLIEYGADVNAIIQEDESTPLKIAARSGSKGVVALLIEHGTSETSQEDWVQELFLEAIGSHQSGALVEFLIAKGAQIDTKDDYGWTPLHYAAQYHDEEATEILLKHGADINDRNCDGNTPLHLTAEYNNWGVTEILILNGADISLKNNDGKTPLMVAMEENHKEIIDLLKSHMPDDKDR